MTQIIKCRIESILGAKQIEFVPNGNSVTIGGKNGQGKSSAIWALSMALGGKKQIPEKPVHNGSSEGRVLIELDSYNVEMKVSDDREVKLNVHSKQGLKFSSPRKILDELFGNLSFDPGEFRLFEKEKRIKTLLEFANLDFTELDDKYKQVYEARTYASKGVNALITKLSLLERFEDVATDEVDVTSLLNGVRECDSKIERIAKIESLLDSIDSQVSSKSSSIIEQQSEIERLTAKIAEIEANIVERRDEISELSENRRIASDNLEELKKEGPDPFAEKSALMQQIENADLINGRIRSNRQYDELHEDLELKVNEVAALNETLIQIQKDKEDALKSAPFPIPGLSFDEGDVTFNGIPFSQLSESEQWRVSTAISFSLNKNGVVFLRQSGGLDKDSRKAIRDAAAECGVQLFMEVVDDADDVQILIEDGSVKNNRLESSKVENA